MILQPLWDRLLATLGADFFAFPLYFLMTIVVVVAATGIFYSVLDTCVHHRVSVRVVVLDGLKVMSGYIAAAALLYLGFLETRLAELDVPAQAPALPVLVFHVSAFMVIGELLTYGWHRLEHGSRLVFDKVHYLHHSVDNPLTVWTNFVVHPVEGLMVLACLYVVPLAVGAHPLTVMVYAAVNTTVMVVTHSGYDFRFYPTWLFPAASGHELHHSERRPTNLSVIMSFGDRLFGTYVKPRSN